MKKSLLYIQHLSDDKRFLPLLEAHSPFTLQRRKNVCLQLCASIMSQQLSTKVAKVIYERFLNLYSTQEPQAEQIIETSPEMLRSIGLSNAKVAYVHNVAKHAIEYGMEDEKLYAMTDQEIIDFLLPIKGVGRWTIEMLLMFTLAREDIFAVDDLGIQQSMIKLYGLTIENKKKLRETMLSIASAWSPYRTYACLHLWQYKNTL